MSGEKSKAGELVRVGAGAAAAAAIAVTIHGPAAGAAMALVTERALGGLGDWVRDRRRKRWDDYFRAYLDEEVDPDTVEAKLHALGDDPLVQEAVLEAVRGLDEALSDVVVPALARLTRLYATSGRPADAFFRGLRRVLQELNREAFAELVELLHIVKEPHGPGQAIVKIDSGKSPFDTPNMGQLLHLMKSNQLASEEGVGGFASAHGIFISAEQAIVKCSIARQVLAVVDSAEELRWV